MLLVKIEMPHTKKNMKKISWSQLEVQKKLRSVKRRKTAWFGQDKWTHL